MTQETNTTKTPNFRKIKAATDIETVLEFLGLLDGLDERGAELVGHCPLGKKKHGINDSFAINRQEKTFQCFSCNANGSILDFVARFSGVHTRDAAEMVDQINNGVLCEPMDEHRNQMPKESEPVLQMATNCDIRIDLIYRRFARFRNELDELESLVVSVISEEAR